MSGTTFPTSGAPSSTRPGSWNPRDHQQVFHRLPEKRKRELAQVVSELARVQGKRAAQAWLEQHLNTSTLPKEGDARRPDMLTGELVRVATEPEDTFTQRRDDLVTAAPTTLEVLSEEEKQVRNAVAAAETFSQEEVERVAPTLTRQSTKVFEFLHLFACAYALTNSQSLKAHQISFFLPAETITLATGVPERTVYDALRRIKLAGLVDHRGHVTTLEGYGNRCDGTVFAVKLCSERTGEARLTYADLKVSDYRDLAADIHEGRTVYRLAQSNTWAYNLRDSVCRLLNWTRSKCTVSWDEQISKPRNLTLQVQSRDGLEAILDLANGPKVTRGQRIGAAAKAIARALGDQHSLTFWWRFCDGLTSLIERGERDYTPAVKACIQREVTAKAEGFARCPAALFITRLKAAGVYGEVMAS